MTRLVDAMRALGLSGTASRSGRWITLQGERSRVHVVELRWDGGYYTWCDVPEERTVEHYEDAVEAIRAGLGRAVRRPDEERSNETDTDEAPT